MLRRELLVAAAAYIRWDRVKQGHYFWQDPPPPAAAPATVPAAPAAAPAAEPAK